MKRPHQLEEAELRDRIEKLADKIANRLGGAWEWRGDAVVSESRGVKARVRYDEVSIFVEVSLPMSMGLFRRQLESKIDEYLGRLLDTE